MNAFFRLYFCTLAATSGLIIADAFVVGSRADDAPQASGPQVDKLIKALEDQASQLSAQEEKIADQEKALTDERRSLEQEKIQFEKLKTQVITLTGQPLPRGTNIQEAKQAQSIAASTEAVSPSGSVETKPVAAGVPSEVGTERKEKKEKPPEITALTDAGGVLTAAGKIVITPAIEYDRSSATAVEISGFSVIPAINIGLFDVSQVNRDFISPSLDLRYGVTNRFEIEAKVPYVYRNDTTLERPVGVSTADTLTSISGEDIGDVEVAAHYQVNSGQDGWPYFIANMRFKTATGTSPFDVPVIGGVESELPTGSGFYAVQPSLTAIFPSDPVVYYANIGYLHSFQRSFPGYGTIDPGDAYSASMGMSLSLNDKSSFSIGYSHTMALKTYEDGAPLTDSTVLQIGSVDLGYSYNLNESVNLNFTVSAGVTSDAPDVRLIFRVPMTFDLL